MNQLAYKIDNENSLPEIYLVAKAKHEVVDNSVYFWAGMLISLQVLDGILTAIGMERLGIQAEGNVILRYFMELLGHVPALVIMKSFAIAIIICLCQAANTYSWIKYALQGVNVLYICAAILPWMIVLDPFL